MSVLRYFGDRDRLNLPATPNCPRKEPIAGRTDWLTLSSDDLFTICPTCYENVFADARQPQFRQFFKPFVPQDSSMKLFCEFGSSPWYVVAWLLSIKRGHRDLRLFQDVSRIVTDHSRHEDSCPGSRADSRPWYSVYDPARGGPVPEFNVCHECAAIVGALMPNLKEVLETRGASGYGVCALHCGAGKGDRGPFLQYIDALERASDDAAAQQGAEVSEARLAEDLAHVVAGTGAGAGAGSGGALLPPCPRDRGASNQKWWHLEWLPDLSVCPSCYEEAAFPLLDESPRSAERFRMKRGKLAWGTCQLYSERMRAVFREACRTDNRRLLVEAVLDRRDREEECRAKVERLEAEGDPFAMMELKRVREDWKEFE